MGGLLRLDNARHWIIQSFNAHLGTGWKPALAPGSSGEISPVGARPAVPVPAQEPGTHTVGRTLRALGAQTGNGKLRYLPLCTAFLQRHHLQRA